MKVQYNATSAYFYGGIYASRVAKEVGVTHLPYDPILYTHYLDFEAMKRHKFLKGTITDYTYNLRFNKETVVPIILPAPAFFGYYNKEIYYVLESEARSYKAEFKAARRPEEAAPRASVSYHSGYYAGRGW